MVTEHMVAGKNVADKSLHGQIVVGQIVADKMSHG